MKDHMNGVRVDDTIFEVCPRCYGSGERRYETAPWVRPVAVVPVKLVSAEVVVCCDRCKGNGVTNGI